MNEPGKARPVGMQRTSSSSFRLAVEDLVPVKLIYDGAVRGWEEP